MRKDPWPSTFYVPEFSMDINFQLRQEDLAYMKDGTWMAVSLNVILEKLAETVCKYKYIPHRGTESSQEVA